jgi:SRSO17 transposase
VYLGYASRKEHALVDARLYLNAEWAKDKQRRTKCGVPQDVRFRTRHQLALEMLDEHGSVLPHAWIAGDDEMGRSSAFRGELRARGERYLLAVPSNTLVRDLEAEPPAYSGHGRPPQIPFTRADRWCADLAEDAWTTIEVRDGAKGPLVVQGVKTPVQAKTDRRRSGPEETLVVFREPQADGTMKHDYYLSNGSPEIPLAEFARVAKSEHRIEECLERAKSEAGMAQYQVRNWVGWHHHQALSLLAVWFLTQEQRRGKKIHPGPHGADRPHAHRLPLTPRPRLPLPRVRTPPCHPGPPAQPTSAILPLEIT